MKYSKLCRWYGSNVWKSLNLKVDITKFPIKLITDNMVQVNVGGNIIDITVDNKLSFEPHLNKICKKVSQKLYALARISTHISLKKLGMIMREFIISRYSYCPLVRYAIAGLLNNKNNKRHEWA